MKIFFNSFQIKGLSDSILVLTALVFTLPLLVLLIVWQIIHPLVSHEEVFKVSYSTLNHLAWLPV